MIALESLNQFWLFFAKRLKNRSWLWTDIHVWSFIKDGFKNMCWDWAGMAALAIQPIWAQFWVQISANISVLSKIKTAAERAHFSISDFSTTSEGNFYSKEIDFRNLTSSIVLETIEKSFIQTSVGAAKQKISSWLDKY